MTFEEAIAEVVKQAQEENRLIYLYKNRIGNFQWGASAQYWNDWLFKAYPGGRKVLSVEGNKLLRAQGERTMSIVDEEYPEIVQGLKRVQCIDCGCVDFIDRSGDESGWEFVGYDDDTELHRCPSCILAKG